MNVRFLTLAQQEVDEAVQWFEERAEGKGLDFLDEFDRIVRLIRSHPLASPEIEPQIRRCYSLDSLTHSSTVSTVKRSSL